MAAQIQYIMQYSHKKLKLQKKIKTTVTMTIKDYIYIQGGPKKSKPPPIFQKIALKIANEIRFLRKVKV